MKRLMVFDIENSQNDYSLAMEFTLLLRKGEIKKALDLAKNTRLNEKISYSLVETDTPRYLECYMFGEPEQYDEKQSVLSTAEILKKYYEFCRQESSTPSNEVKKLLSRPVKELDNLYQREKNGVLKVHIPGYFRARFNTNRSDETSRQLETAAKNDSVRYHFRVRVNPDEIYKLQYLALLLQCLIKMDDNDTAVRPLQINEKNISVVLLDTESTKNCFPFCEFDNTEKIKQLNESHRTFSRFLKLVAKNATGIIYAPYYKEIKENGRIYLEPNLKAMDYEDISSGDRFFPLMEITKEIYNTLFADNTESENRLPSTILARNLFQEGNNVQNKTTLFQIGRLRFFNANNKDPREAFLAYIAETSWKYLEKKHKNIFTGEEPHPKNELFNTIVKRFAAKNGEKNNWLTFALFSFLLGGADTKQINEAYQTARELSLGLQQLMQNAIQHSEFSSCYFTFYLDRLDDDDVLRLSVVDVNTKQDLINNFKRRLDREISLCKEKDKEPEKNICYSDLIEGHSALVNAKEYGIALGHFFNKFDASADNGKGLSEKDAREMWKKFRSADSTAHVGLLIFYQSVLNCQANFILQSSASYNRTDNTVFHEGNVDSGSGTRIIPGTQYIISVLFSKMFKHNPAGEANISNIKGFSEDYGAFAEYIDYKPEFFPNDIETAVKGVKNKAITGADDKFSVQLYWADIWAGIFSRRFSGEQTVWQWRVQGDMQDYLGQIDNCEVFLKGLFAALNRQLAMKSPIYFAVTNLPGHFLDSLRAIIISLSAKPFLKTAQLYFVDRNCSNYAQLFGSTFLNVTLNAIQLSIEHGSELFRQSDYEMSKTISLVSENDSNNSDAEKIKAIPFDVLVRENSDSPITIFDSRMMKMVEKDLGGADSHGYKLSDTHMRLGSKVHIQSFYEMSFLFYRTTIANRIAFKILRLYSAAFLAHLSEETYKMSPLMFYSYASYSKAILTSLVEISREYLKIHLSSLLPKDTIDTKREEKIKSARAQIAFASYQHNLQNESKNNDIQLYFGIEAAFSGGTHQPNKNKIELTRETDLVLVVPISTTFTTFDKMLSELKKQCDGYSNFKLREAYTAFWVCDDKGEKNDTELFPSEIEKKYWLTANDASQTITVNTGEEGLKELAINPIVHYFMRVKTNWELPLICSLCFPEKDKLLCEVPLVETDPTSTVPAQQIRSKLIESPQRAADDFEKNYSFHLGAKRTNEKKDKRRNEEGNNYRLLLLEGSIYYGHIIRGKNHHQYYINTQDYFYKSNVQSELRNWLKGLRAGESQPKLPCLQIIFSPEHNTNVGFAQYVNTYYFGGSAEIISINADKEFRSNFICEHEILRQTIERLHIQKGVFDEKSPVEFYFVDDNINTGETIHKANGFLRSLLPDGYLKDYPALLFNKCFFLIDRLSKFSKQPYVRSESAANFHSFVHIDISNMRKQGDSCVGCKLQEEAKHLFKRSALRQSANYWANKYQRYRPVQFDSTEEMAKLKDDAYERMMLTHIAQNFIFTDGVRTRTRGDYYDSVIFIFDIILRWKRLEETEMMKRHFCFTELLNKIVYPTDRPNNNLKMAELLIKLLARPFFSFDFDFRIQFQSFLLIIAEYYLDVCLGGSQNNIASLPNSVESSEHKRFLLDNERIAKTMDIAQKMMVLHTNNGKYTDKDTGNRLSRFFNDVLFEALADLRSTYLLRKHVIRQVKSFARTYLANVSPECKTGDCRNPNQDKGCAYLLDRGQCETKSVLTCFWTGYLAHIQRIIDGGSDELRSVWFERLLLTGKELDSETNNNAEVDISTDFIKDNIDMFLLNAMLGFDVVEKAIDVKSETQYYLNSYQKALDWTNQTLYRADSLEINEVKEWYNGLITPADSDNGEVFEIKERYKQFLERLLAALAALHQKNGITKSCINVALLTMARKKREETIGVEDFQIVQDAFGAGGSADEKEARYIIKDRVSTAYSSNTSKKKAEPQKNECEYGDLIEDGYFVCCAEPISDKDYEAQQKKIEYDGHHVAHNHRKPYIIIHFDNPNHGQHLLDDLGRKLAPLSNVFLYVSMDFSKGSNISGRNHLPWIILRNILAYRNRIMRFLAEDFNGDIMGKYATSTQQENILTHERAASHATTTDDCSILQVFGVDDVYVSELKELTYPIDLPNKKLIDGQNRSVSSYKSSELWLLLQNYVNGQIARLFNRSFIANEKLESEAGVPALYVTEENENIKSVFKKRLIHFQELDLETDNRFLLLKKAVTMELHKSLFDIDVYHSQEYENAEKKLQLKKYFNIEYMRCILLDIILTSIKYATPNDSLLPRVNRLMRWKGKERSPASVCCRLILFRIKEDLVILNNIKKNMMDKRGCPAVNEEIYRRIHDPLDYGDGHMSLFTIRKFILGIRAAQSSTAASSDTSFQYVSREEIVGNSEYKKAGIIEEYRAVIEQDGNWFQTRLPIFKEENSNG